MTDSCDEPLVRARITCVRRATAEQHGRRVATSFTYDGLGRRLTRSSGGTTTQFLSSGDTDEYRVWLEAVGSTVTSQYSYGTALIRKDSEYPLYDGLGSERTVTNGSQTVTGTLNLDAFGQLAGSTGSSANPYMYAGTSGYRNDGDAGLTHVRARYYDAQVGRWTSRDPVLSEHPYLYSGHNPVNYLDPSGGVMERGFVLGGLLILLGVALFVIPAASTAAALALLAAGVMVMPLQHTTSITRLSGRRTTKLARSSSSARMR
jgi:RHS repeat-associated protein